MTSLNPIPPVMRARNRYVVYEAICERPLRREDVGKAVWRETLTFLGELGASRSALRIVEFDEKKQKGIIKVDHKHVDEAKVALALVREINKKPVILNVLGVSGILKKARCKWLT